MRLITWWMRLSIVIVAGALVVSALVVSVAPRLWNAANAHDQDPITLPEWGGIAQRSYVYDAKGNEIAAYELENSQPVSLSQIPQGVIDAILAVEDREFYRHKGVNVRGLFRATLSNFEGGARQGASTITQQVVKIEYLGGLERDGRYKLLQIIYALRLEKERTKEEILERYLNTIFLGNNTYGIQAAAEVYFGKRVEDLTLVEGTFLAGLIQAPSSYDPIRKPEQSKRRFTQVLDSVVEVGLMERDEADVISSCLQPFETEEQRTRCEGSWQIPEIVRSIPEKTILRTHFSEEVKSYLLNRSNLLGESYRERYNRLFRGGLRIHTTLDPDVQRAAEAAKTEKLPQNLAGIEAAVVTVDSRTGAVRAMVGGRPFVPGRNEVNLALATRQTGSSIKIFILAAAVQAGVQNNDLIDGTLPCTFPNPDDPTNPFEIGQGVSRGVSTLEEMTWFSINCAYARLSQAVGLDRVVDTTYRMASSEYLRPAAVETTREPIRPYASFATGANEMSPLDMASGAQTLANGGVHMEPYLVERIEDPQGIVYQHENSGTVVFTPDVANRITSILKGVMTSGTARRSALTGRESAGKTGTQDNNTNAWFVGYTPELTTAVWVGHPDLYLPMNNIPEFVAAGVRRVQGGTFPAAIWKATMDSALSGVPPSRFAAPATNLREPFQIFLPGVDCLAYATPQSSLDSLLDRFSTTSTTQAEDLETPETTAFTAPVTPASGYGTVANPPPDVARITTTVPRGMIDPIWPVPTVDPIEYAVVPCRPVP